MAEGFADGDERGGSLGKQLRWVIHSRADDRA
jgi:hypothetical protein